MPTTIDRLTNILDVPQSDLAFVSGTLWAQDTKAFWDELKAIEASEEGMPFPNFQIHKGETTVAGVTYARFIIIVAPYTVRFEDGQYAALLEGSNNNIFDEGIIVRNQVSIIPTNSAGLQIVTQGSGLSGPQAAQLSELWQRLGLDVGDAVTVKDGSITVAGITLLITKPDADTTVITRQP